MNANFTFIDLFAGIGGLRLPFDELGGLCLLTSEIDTNARLTYEANFGTRNPATHQFNSDIRSLDESAVPNHDLLLAGFPCQPFSHAGLRKGFEDMRGTLFFDIMRILQRPEGQRESEIRAPKVIVLENVKGLKTHDKGRTLARIREELRKIYFLTEAVLDARDFGLPQSRQRLFMVGIRKDVDGADLFDESFMKALQSVQDSRVPSSVRQILTENADEKYRISDRIWASHKERKLRHQEKGNGWGFKLVTPDSPYTATISARYHKDGAEILVQDDDAKNPRKLTPREAARLQGFPDSFEIPVSDTQAYRQFGNAVAINVSRFVAQQVSDYLR